MTLKEIFDSEKENFDKIYLYKEGIFWKAYEKSAFHFCQHIAPFKPTKKFIKNIGCDIVSIGFPVANLDKYSNKYKIAEQSETLTILSASEITGGEFEQWKNSLVCSTKKPDTKVEEPQMDIITQIRNFNLESKTPMECMMWIAKIKQQLNI